MKKIIALSLSISTIIISGWLILKNIDHLDIASNKIDSYIIWEKKKIDERIDIDFCEKQLLKNNLDCRRKNDRIESEIAFQTQFFALIIIIIQLILLVFILMSPTKLKNHNPSIQIDE
ncbi:hypothetical protein [Paenimyroides aestuarii]|uniref:Uncharacterized protein n=1 Tax=Paenimyroides aestuarii TaxID=2968490 RepID=A0ABY5NPJ4_9FLAO|nr:hypothetical protein [Paenimyroides aestuarii]UUV20481.1 hypothetical protein NPX36_08890 [Paenimyroides aestuarii]